MWPSYARLLKSNKMLLTRSPARPQFAAWQCVYFPSPLPLPTVIKREDLKATQSRFSGLALKVAETELTPQLQGVRQNEKEKKNKDKRQLGWEEKFALLKAFKKAHGHCSVPPGYVVGGVKLGGWVATQRKEYTKHRFGLFSAIINEKRVTRLEKVGFEWNVTPTWTNFWKHAWAGKETYSRFRAVCELN